MDSKNLIIFICAGSVVNYTHGETKEIVHAITKPHVAAIDAYRSPMMQHSNESSSTDAVIVTWPTAMVTTTSSMVSAVSFTLKNT
jgi:hypothetical protein